MTAPDPDPRRGARAREGRVVRSPYGGGLSFSAFGGSWVCDHIDWLTGDGVLLVPVPLDVPIVIDDITAPVDLDALDNPRITAAVRQALQTVDLHGRTPDRSSLHECHRTVRSAVHVVRLSPPPPPPPV